MPVRHAAIRTAIAAHGCIRSPDIGDLERIYDDDVAIAAWQPAVRPELLARIESSFPGRELTVLERVDARAPRLDAVLRGFAPGTERSPLGEWLIELLELYSILADSDAIGLRLSVTRGRPCPRFHVDRVGLRLICTLRGPATEWLRPHDADRRYLSVAGLDDSISGLLRPGTVIQRLATLDVGLFKGEAWPGFVGRGVVHRSPAPDGDWRVVVTLDEL